jgi:hypothetical protein
MTTTQTKPFHMSTAQHRDTAVLLQQFDKDSALRFIENLRKNNIADDNCNRLIDFVNSNRFGTLS